MILNSIQIENFRNITKAKITLGEKLNLVLGVNAAGKTSFLEAIHFVTTGRSFRGARENTLINHNSSFARLVGTIQSREGERIIEMAFDRQGKKRLSVDKVSLKRMSELLNLSAVVSVAPSDIVIIVGPPDNRRRFLDTVLSHCFPAYLSSLSSYTKALRQKNALLREQGGTDFKQLDIWNKQLTEYGEYILSKRLLFMDFLKKRGKEIYYSLSKNEEVEFAYSGSFAFHKRETIRGDFQKALNENLKRELKLRQSVIGIHRDNIRTTIDRKPVRQYGSRGQQRCAMISMKFAALEFMERIRNEKPLLLLDEAVSELDEKRSVNLLGLSASVGQVIIASTFQPREVKLDSKTKFFEIADGNITPLL